MDKVKSDQIIESDKNEKGRPKDRRGGGGGGWDKLLWRGTLFFPLAIEGVWVTR